VACTVIGFPASIGYSPRYFLEQLTPEASAKHLILLVPGERIELPTNGLQNRCSTAELTRLANNFSALVFDVGFFAPILLRHQGAL
jgi:hypothetical protein